jgi:hypothetical protein
LKRTVDAPSWQAPTGFLGGRSFLAFLHLGIGPPWCAQSRSAANLRVRSHSASSCRFPPRVTHTAKKTWRSPGQFFCGALGSSGGAAPCCPPGAHAAATVLFFFAGRGVCERRQTQHCTFCATPLALHWGGGRSELIGVGLSLSFRFRPSGATAGLDSGGFFRPNPTVSSSLTHSL